MTGRPDAGPTARALLALDVIQAHPGIQAWDLAARLDVSERAARRYVAVLREASIPIESTTGRYGGYRVGRGLRLPPVRFEAAEAVGVVMAALDGHPGAGDPDDVVGNALGKIIRALPESIAAQAELIRSATAATPDRSAARPDAMTTATLVEACVRHRQVRVDYRTERGRDWSQIVDPWAVVIRHGRWYLLCWAHESGAQRALRVDRVTAVSILPVEFRPPPPIDPVAALEAHLGDGWAHPIEVVLDAPLGVVQEWFPRTKGRLEAIDAGVTRLIGSSNQVGEYAADLARVPFGYRIVGGDAFRAAAAQVAARLQAALG